MKHTSSISFRENKQHGSQEYPCAFYQAKSSLWPFSTPFQTKYHWHEELEIVHFQKGRFHLEINMQKYDISEECFCFIGSGELHYIYSKEDFEEQAFVFSLPGLSFAEHDPVQTQIIRPLLDGELSLPAVVTRGNACFEEILRAFSGLCAAFPGTVPHTFHQDQYVLSNTAQYLRVKIGLYSIFLALIDNGLLSDAASGPDRRISTIKKALSYMKEHAGEKLYVQDIAAQVNMNGQYFCRFFRKMIGKSPIEYLTELRIKNACELLQNTDLTVTEICLECGFNNLGNFMNAFRRYCGCTPGQYRKSK